MPLKSPCRAPSPRCPPWRLGRALTATAGKPPPPLSPASPPLEGGGKAACDPGKVVAGRIYSSRLLRGSPGVQAREAGGGGAAAGVRGGAAKLWKGVRRRRRLLETRSGRISAAWAVFGRRDAGGGLCQRRGGADACLPFGAAAGDVL